MTSLGELPDLQWVNASSLSPADDITRNQVTYNLYQTQQQHLHAFADVSDWLAYDDDKVTALALSPDIKTLFIATKSETTSEHQGQISLRCIALNDKDEWQSWGLRLAINGEVGFLIDSAIAGIRFVGKGYSGFTDSNGMFIYKSSEKVNFYLGDESTGIILGTVVPNSTDNKGKKIVTVFDLVDSSDINNHKVINMGKLLQSLDHDQNPDNGIVISEITKTIIAELGLSKKIDFDVTVADFMENTDIKNLLTKISEKLEEPSRTLVSTEQAQAHLIAVRDRIQFDSQNSENNNDSTSKLNTGSTNTGSTNTSSTNTGSTNTSSTNTDTTNTGSTNTDSTNTGSTNTDTTNTGSTNTSSTNTGSTNTSSTDTSSTNTSSTNTDTTNTGSTNTSSTNTGSTNTGSTNTDTTNTGSTNTGSTNTSSTNTDTTNTDSTNTTTSGTTETTSQQNISGTVVDGEISGATLFLDLNRNGEFDASEPTTTTDATGEFSLTLTPAQANHANYLNKTAPLIAFGGTDIRTNKPFEDSLSALVSSDGEVNVTPISTLIAVTLADDIEAGLAMNLANINQKINEIKTNIASLLNIRQDLLNANPIELAKQGDSSLLNGSLQLHKTAKVMKKAMKRTVAKNKRTILKAYKSLGRKFKGLQRSAIRQGNTALSEALELTLEENSDLFDNALKTVIKNEAKNIISAINTLFSNHSGNFNENDLTSINRNVDITVNNADVTAPNPPTLTTMPTTTTEDSVAIEINGEAETSVFINNIEFVTLDATGTVTTDLDTSGDAGVKAFSIVLTDEADNASNPLNFTIMRIVNNLNDTTTPATPTSTQTPTTTDSNNTTIEINGEVGATVWVNDSQVATIGATGKVNIDLNTSGDAGTKTFTIFLKDESLNTSQTLTLNVERILINRVDALKFLRQAAFRSSETDISYVMANGYEAWIDNQFNIVGDLDDTTDTKYGYLESVFRLLNQYDATAYPTATFTTPTLLDESVIDGLRLSAFRGSVFWHKVLDNEDQLRQRLTYALSQILVTSDISPAGQAPKYRAESLAHYYDILNKHSFGNYRALLTDVTYSPLMGFYLTYVGGKKEAPDENYARELTQLFTIGLYELNDDGTKPLSGGNPIPSYNQTHVTNLSKVFTGWDLDDLQLNSRSVNARYGSTAKTDNSWLSPLQFTDQHHDITNKTILGDKVIQADVNGVGEITQALDYLFANHNIAPHISRHLIMRFTTSNPTPDYIARVSAVFNNNGSGVKGDLKAVIKAILLDPEARGETTVTNFGKVDEIIIAFSHFLQAFNAHPIPTMNMSNSGTDVFINNIYWLSPDKRFGQAVLGADSVFNFYSNEFVPSSQYFATNNLVSPELQIQNEPNLIGYSNLIDSLLNTKEKYTLVDLGNYASIQAWAIDKEFGRSLVQGLLYLDLTTEYNVLEKALDNEIIANGDFSNMGNGTGTTTDRTRAVNALLDHLDTKLLGGTMPEAYKNALIAHINTFDFPRSVTGRKNRAKAIVQFSIRAIVTSPLFMILK